MKSRRFLPASKIKHILTSYAAATLVENSIFIFVGIALALALRYTLRVYESRDFVLFTSGWYDTICKNGFSAFAKPFSNYTPAYEYLLYIITRLFPGLLPVIATKLPSMLADFIAALFAALLVRLHSALPQAGTGQSEEQPKPGGSLAAMLAFWAVLFAPSVVLNSAAWGQADMLYACPLLACVFFLARGLVTGRRMDGRAMLCFGLAFAFKLQAIFLAPFLVVLLLKRKLAWWSLLCAPLVYAILIIPSWLVGRPLVELLSIYANQAVDTSTKLTLNMPNLYAWLPDEPFRFLFNAGLVFAAGACCIYILLAYKSPKPLTPALLVELALLSIFIMVYTLPEMHERYLFAADVFGIVYLFYFPKRFTLPLAANLVSFFAYSPFLFNQILFPLPGLALVTTAVLAGLVYYTIQDLFF